MNPIDKYISVKNELENFRQWKGLIGKEYFGGTRGKGGEFGEVVSATGNLTIYYQQFDGAKNYHDTPEYVMPILNDVILKMAPEIIEKIEQRLVQKLSEVAADARKLK